jgi:hypothetical protein
MSKIIQSSLFFLMLFFSVSGTSSDAQGAEPAVTQPSNAYLDLNRQLPEFKLDSATPLEGAIESLRNAAHANIVVDWPSVEDAGVRRDAPVRIHLWDVTVDQALRAMIAVVDHEGLIAHQPQNGIILVATRDKLRRVGQVVRVYDVRPIIDDLYEDRRLRAATTQSIRQEPRAPASGPAPRLDEANEALVRMIQATVEPQGWHDPRWGEGFARPFAGRLIITQTPENHRKIAELLRVLRKGGSKDGTPVFGR